ncbi:hypothetical protein ACIP5Y_12265 [Nocardia sp. NPDC088792]|uniref:hypothetical protein n=1 Tax=Nocardia sp. NPDC088792 TaxID=3364332 RepID=UPI00382BFB47
MPTFDALFERTPPQWGLRGDPYLWDALRERLRGRPIPETFWDVRVAVEDAIAAIIGAKLDPVPDRYAGQPVSAFAVGHGMSDGVISAHWWQHTGIPLLIDRAEGARAGEYRPGHRPEWETAYPPPQLPSGRQVPPALPPYGSPHPTPPAPPSEWRLPPPPPVPRSAR